MGTIITTADQLIQLTASERTALETFIARLRQRYGDDLLHVVLFGSKARGDFDDESDLDLLIVVRIPDSDFWPNWRHISDLAWEVELAHDVVLTTIIRTPAEFRQMQRDRLLLYQNIEKDGMTLWTSQPDAPMSKPV
jgi:predicted nucleotidyltransferase